MSWDTYVSNMEGEGCSYSGFFDHDGNKWAESPNGSLKVTPEQIEGLVKGMKGKTVNSGQSVMFGGHKFLVVDKTDNTAVMKELGGETKDKMMACVSMSNRSVCVGAACGEKEKCSRASAEKYAEYLRSNNM